MFLKSKVFAAALLQAAALAACHGMNPFAADLGATGVGNKVARAPYMSQFTYLGRYEPQDAPTGSASDDPKVAIYFWLPMSTPELGVRFISGARPQVLVDGHKDVAEAAYMAHVKDDIRFDPTVELQRCLTVLEPQDVAEPCGQWVSLGQNDDSAEMPEMEHGVRTGSLLRVSSVSQDPTKTLTAGLYRVVVGGAKGTTPRGNFLLQMGAPVLLDAVAMGRSPEGLLAALRRPPDTFAPQKAQLQQHNTTDGLGGTAVPLDLSGHRGE